MSADIDTAPRRVDPRSIWIGYLKKAPSTLIGLPAVLAVTSDRGLFWIVGITLAVSAVSLAFTWFHWRHFTYSIHPEELVIERGLLNKRRRSIPLERIQDVSIEQGALARLFGLALVKIETGGGESDEGELDSVTLAEAARLRAVLRGERAASLAGAEAGEGAEAEHPPETRLFAMPLGRILLYGIFNFSLVWVAAIGAMVQFFGDAFGYQLDDLIKLIWGYAEREIAPRASISAAVGLAGVVLVLGLVTGVVRTVLRDFGFRLMLAPGRMRRVQGLLARSETVVAIRRIQLGLVRRAPLRGALGWQSLSVQTLGGSNDPSGLQRLAPFARAEEVAAVLDGARLPPFERQELRPVAIGHVVRALIRHALVPGAVLAIGSIFFPPLWPGLIVVPFLVGLALLRRRFHRYALRETSLQVAQGVLLRRDWILPYRNVQAVTIVQGPLQRLLGIATVTADSAGAAALGRPRVSDVAEGDAAALAMGLIART